MTKKGKQGQAKSRTLWKQNGKLILSNLAAAKDLFPLKIICYLGFFICTMGMEPSSFLPARLYRGPGHESTLPSEEHSAPELLFKSTGSGAFQA